MLCSASDGVSNAEASDYAPQNQHRQPLALIRNSELHLNAENRDSASGLSMERDWVGPILFCIDICAESSSQCGRCNYFNAYFDKSDRGLWRSTISVADSPCRTRINGCHVMFTASIPKMGRSDNANGFADMP